MAILVSSSGSSMRKSLIEKPKKEVEFKETDSDKEEVTIINGLLSGYKLRPIGDEFLKKKNVPEGAIRFGLYKPNATKPYVMMVKDGTVSCGCPAWTRNKERECKHTREVTTFLISKSGYSISSFEGKFKDIDELLEFLL